ncbi:MAG: response regulator [Candidatus Binatia bacterium]
MTSTHPQQGYSQESHVGAFAETTLVAPSSTAGSTLTATADSVRPDHGKDVIAGDIIFSPIDFNVRTTVEETVSRFAASAQRSGVELSCLFSCDSPTPFRGDPGNVRLILMTLIDSALLALEQGEIVVRTSLVQQVPTHGTFRFSITSNGAPTIGGPIAVETAMRQCQQLVEAMGGQVGQEKSPTGGTTVWFTLTLERQPPKALSTITPRTNLSGIQLLEVGPPSTFLEENLDPWGIMSRQVNEVDQVLPMLTAAVESGFTYDILLLRAHQLEEPLLLLSTSIRDITALASLRLVLLLKQGKKGDAERVRKAGFDAYFTEPVSPALLFDCFATILSQPSYALTPHQPLVTRYTLAEARLRERARVLVIDSNAVDQKHLAYFLDQLGYRPDVVVTAREAIEAHARLPYAAVFLPLQMSGIDGLTAATQIRQNDQREGSYTPIIGILSQETHEDLRQCYEVSMDTYLVKPLTAEAVCTALDQCLSPSGVQPSESILTASAYNTMNDLDLQNALARVDGDKELFDEMIALFLEEYPKSLMKLREAVIQQDVQAVAYTANTLRGSLGNFTATGAIEAASQLEHMGRQGNLINAKPALTELEKQLLRLEALLSDFRLQAAA